MQRFTPQSATVCLVSLFGIVTLLWASPALQRQASAATHQAARSASPAFTLPLYGDSGTKQLQSRALRGKVVVIRFLASW